MVASHLCEYISILSQEKMLTLSNLQCFFCACECVCICLCVWEEKEVKAWMEEKVRS